MHDSGWNSPVESSGNPPTAIGFGQYQFKGKNVVSMINWLTLQLFRCLIV
jgi:hypothetical protein